MVSRKPDLEVVEGLEGEVASQMDAFVTGLEFGFRSMWSLFSTFGLEVIMQECGVSTPDELFSLDFDDFHRRVERLLNEIN